MFAPIWIKQAPPDCSVWQGSQGSSWHLKLGWCGWSLGHQQFWDTNRKPPGTPHPAEPRAFLPVQLPRREDAFELNEDLGNLGYGQNMSETTSDLAFGLYIYIVFYCICVYIHIYIYIYIYTCVYVCIMRTILRISHAVVHEICMRICAYVYIIMPMDG